MGISIIDKNELIDLKSIDQIWQHMHHEKEIQYFWLGRQNYVPICNLQKELHAKRVKGEISDVVLMLEHEHVFTFGKNSNKDYLLDSKSSSVDIVEIDRGGQVTYHGPGQLVCYPIIDLHDYNLSISWYMRSLEQVISNFLLEYQIKSNQKKGYTGVWIEDEKICAMGVRLSKWVTMHGFALNSNPNMNYYDGMIPCGIFEYGVTSLHKLGFDIKIKKLALNIMKHFNNIFTS